MHRRLNVAQCHLESSIGTLKRTAAEYDRRGDATKAIRLRQHAQDIAELRDPDAIEILESRLAKEVLAEQQGA